VLIGEGLEEEEEITGPSSKDSAIERTRGRIILASTTPRAPIDGLALVEARSWLIASGTSREYF